MSQQTGFLVQIIVRVPLLTLSNKLEHDAIDVLRYLSCSEHSPDE